MKKARIVSKQYDLSLARQLAEELNVSLPIAKLLLTRKIEDASTAKRFLNPSRAEIHDPFLLSDMDKAVKIIAQAVNTQENICIYGDYDVDGITATSLLYLFLQEIGAKVQYYLPDRIKDGYGLNEGAVRKLAEQAVKLIITVDTGISAVKEVALARELGMMVVVTDHHECQAILPPADAVIDPKRPDDDYPFKQIAGVGVAFKLICALTEFMQKAVDPFQYLELVAIGTVSDLMPLIDENRVFVKEALARMGRTQNQGLKALLLAAEVEADKVSSSTIGFRIGPRLNAAGRMGNAARGVELFLTSDPGRAGQLASELNDENKKRQEMESRIVEEALVNIQMAGEIPKVLVVAGSGWHHGVVGIVASRLLERFYRPVIVLAMEGDKAVGSARSVEGFNLFEALTSCQDLFTKFGGHEMAAGMTLPVENIEQFKQRINEYAQSRLTDEILTPLETVDFAVEVSEITIPLIEELRMLAPYGIGNPEPKFLVEGRLSEVRQMGKENQHLRLGLAAEQAQMEAVAFFEGEEAERLYGEFPIRATGNIQINEWKGLQKPQMMLSYFSQEEAIAQFALSLYQRLKADQGNCWEYSAPNKESCRQIYLRLRQLTRQKNTRISWQNFPQIFGQNKKRNLAELIAGLVIFEELGLCRQTWTKQGFTFALTEGIKADLEKSQIYQGLHS
ncbi:single-stranded-DNA-specific exonuclease RecJ [Clostridiales bacterium COT073_COT-073]|nr:single-stranded-DNA-specific exonuclease RecJ [Clostridiales bacterium COT073_COT-073]